MIAELAEVLVYPKLQSRLDRLGLTVTDLMTYTFDLAVIVELEEAPDTPLVVADPDDDVFLRCAQVANAAYIISGDHHLLDIETYADIPIVTVLDFFVREFPSLLA